MIKVCDYEKHIRKYQEELEREELEHDRQQLREFIFKYGYGIVEDTGSALRKDKDNIRIKEIKEQFKKNIDELHNEFYDNFDENIPFDQQRIIRKFVDFLKQNV